MLQLKDKFEDVYQHFCLNLNFKVISSINFFMFLLVFRLKVFYPFSSLLSLHFYGKNQKIHLNL